MLTTLLEKLKGIGASWSVYTALGSFTLYFLGYLVLRFQLSTWGVVTDLAAFDERYFFAGARFLVYLVSTVPSVLLLASPFLLFWWLLNKQTRFRAWRESWNYPFAGVVFAVLFIQFVERKCFQFINSLLVQRQLDGDAWLRGTCSIPPPGSEALFFALAGDGRSRDRLAAPPGTDAFTAEARARKPPGLPPCGGVPPLAGELWSHRLDTDPVKGHGLRACRSLAGLGG